MYKPSYIKNILADTPAIHDAIKKAGQWATLRFAKTTQPPIFICLLKGAMQFFSELTLNIELDIREDFTTLNSYRGSIQQKTGLKNITNLSINLRNRDVVIVEDVSDTANTLSALIDNLKKQQPKSITTMVLVDKPDCREKPFKPDYACFTFKGSPFIVGYGMDCNEFGRNLPYLAEFDLSYLK